MPGRVKHLPPCLAEVELISRPDDLVTLARPDAEAEQGRQVRHRVVEHLDVAGGAAKPCVGEGGFDLPCTAHVVAVSVREQDAAGREALQLETVDHRLDLRGGIDDPAILIGVEDVAVGRHRGDDECVDVNGHGRGATCRGTL